MQKYEGKKNLAQYRVSKASLSQYGGWGVGGGGEGLPEIYLRLLCNMLD